MPKMPPELNRYLEAQEDPKLKQLSRDMYTRLCELEVLWECTFCFLGTVEAHAKGRSLEDWVKIWGRVN